MKLPQHIRDKINQIVYHEQCKLELMREISEWKPDKLMFQPVEALDEGWDWEMYFSGSPRPINEKEIEAVILTALTGKVHKVDYGTKYITLKEIRDV